MAKKKKAAKKKVAKKAKKKGSAKLLTLPTFKKQITLTINFFTICKFSPVSIKMTYAQ